MVNLSERRVPEHVRPEQVFEFDIYGDERIRHDLHVGYAKLHDTAPAVFYTPANGGHWMVMRHDMMVEIVKDPEHFSVAEMQIPRVKNPPRFIPLSLDPPENLPYRQLLMPTFSPKRVAILEPQMKAFAAELVDAVASKGECDFVAAISSRFPVGIFMRLMGMPWERFDEFRRITDEHFRAVGSEAVAASMAEISHELKVLLAQRRAEPRDDLMTFLINAQIGGRPITEAELMSICVLLFIAGLDTVTNAMSFGCRYAAGDPALQERLRRDPAAVDLFVEEVIRLFGVVNTPRLVVQDVERFGVQFRRGDMVLSMLPMAGWDASKNEKPGVFDLDRPNRTHLTFSTGPHLCLGHFLARSELKTLFREWFARIPEFHIPPQSTFGIRCGTVMSMRSLPLRWDAALAR
jgi:cytochrome P450